MVPGAVIPPRLCIKAASGEDTQQGGPLLYATSQLLTSSRKRPPQVPLVLSHQHLWAQSLLRSTIPQQIPWHTIQTTQDCSSHSSRSNQANLSPATFLHPTGPHQALPPLGMPIKTLVQGPSVPFKLAKEKTLYR